MDLVEISQPQWDVEIALAYATPNNITGKPILFLGVGQEYRDLKKFEPDWFVDRLLER